MSNEEYDVNSYTFSLITQGKHKFYSLTLNSNILADTCFVTTRYDDPLEGFQRRLDEKRAQEIADYIDSGFGTIPNAVVLSAQPEAELTVKKGGRALTIKMHPKAFLVLDGQHRVWGYKKAASHLRVPVVIYTGLTKAEETRLFIDINTKQKPVPSELLLDIKQLAELEGDTESLLRDLFNQFQKDNYSVLAGKLSPSEKTKGKISRTTFNTSFSNIIGVLGNKPSTELFDIFNGYLGAMIEMLDRAGVKNEITTPNIFKGIISFFPEVASRVKYRFDSEYSYDNFLEIIEPVYPALNKATITKSKASYKKLLDAFNSSMAKNFQL